MAKFTKLAYQDTAIRAIVDLFQGQPLGPAANEIRVDGHTGLKRTEDGAALANELIVDEDAILANLQAVQTANKIDPLSTEIPKQVEGKPPAPWQFSVEMETGTGKTYVYLRTIFTLAQRYGWKKFIIVVPTVAIREGVNTELGRMREHLRERHDAIPFHHWIYTAKDLKKTRDFAESNQLQIMIINIDGFLRDDTVMRADKEMMRGHTGMEYVQSCRPVVILDEPQRLDSEKAQGAIQDFYPLAVLRYSATHRYRHNLVYRLGPAEAYRQNLVKKIRVLGLEEESDFNQPYVKLLSVTPAKRGGHTAKLEVHKQGKSGALVAEIAVKAGDDLAEKADREMYTGYVIEDIECEPVRLTFANGHRLFQGEALGGNRHALQKQMIKDTIRLHLDKEQEMRRLPPDERCKVLSLFFIDRVANYWPADGIFRTWFNELYEEYRASNTYRDLNMPPAPEVHNGYFATVRQGKKGDQVLVAKDTEGGSADDEAAYELIMKKKDELLRDDVPLRFIFSHTALAEGWDNPNIFQLCSLRDIGSETRRRQQIGRGLRIPVRADGNRSDEAKVNVLTVVASESYGNYVQRLQQDVSDETGEGMPAPENARKQASVNLDRDKLNDPAFAELWRQIRQRTRYKLALRSNELIARCLADLANAADVKPPRIRKETATLSVDADGKLQIASTSGPLFVAMTPDAPVPIPDAISYLHRQFPQLTRKTLAEILAKAPKLVNITVNPQAFLDQVTLVIRRNLARLIVEGIEYEKLPEELWWDQSSFEDRPAVLSSRLVETAKRCLYDHVEYDSDIEHEIAIALDRREDIKLFLKLPSWFKVATPVGTYNPDWAVVKEGEQGATQVYLVRESKDTTVIEELDEPEKSKVKCGQKHFDAIGVDYTVITKHDQV